MSDYSIYVACLASYNAGILHGKWIDCTQGTEHVWDEIKDILANSPVGDAEEWEIHDYSFDVFSRGIQNYCHVEDICAIAELLESSNYPAPTIEYALDEAACDPENVEDYLSEYYLGEYENLADYAYQFCQDTGSEIPKWLENYVDYEAMARDWEYSGDIYAIDNGYKSVYIMRAN